MRKLYRFESIVIDCPRCVPSIEAEINEEAERLKISQVSMDYATKTLTVECSADHDTTEEEILKILRKNERLPKDFKPALRPPKPLCASVTVKLPSSSAPLRPVISQSQAYHWQQALFGLATGTTLMILMLLSLIPGGWIHTAIILGSCLATLVLGKGSLYQAYTDLTVRRRFSMDSLFSLSVIAALGASLAHLFFPIMPMLIDVGLMVFGFRHAGQWIEEQYTPQIYQRMRFTDRANNQIYLNEQQEPIALKNIPPGTLITLPPGAVVPLNAILLSDSADFDTTLINGEYHASYTKGKTLLAGMVLQDSSPSIIIQTTATEENSYLEKLETAYAFAQKSDNQAPSQQEADRFLQFFFPIVICAALTVGAVSGMFFGLAIGFKAALYLAVCACPCALGMIIPMAMQIGLDKLEPQGIRFSKTKGLEAAAQTKKIFFDMTGTLTEGRSSVINHSAFSEEDLALIRGMEYSDKLAKNQQVSHPIAQAILEKLGEGKKIIGSITPNTTQGIEMVHEGKVYRLGNAAFTGVSPSSEMAEAQHAIYFTENGQYKGHFLLQDTLRKDAFLTLQTLLANGFEIEILTGSPPQTAKVFAEALKINPSFFTCQLSHADKKSIIEAYQRDGKKAAYIGDSGNDHGALTAASLGIAIHSPHTDVMCKQDGAATYSNKSLLPLVQIFAVGRQTMGHIKQNLRLTFSYNILAMAFVPCAIFLFPTLLNPAFGLLIMATQSTFLLARALYIKNQAASLPELPPIKTRPGKTPPPSPTLSADQEHENPCWFLTLYSAGIPDYLGSPEEAYMRLGRPSRWFGD